MLALKPNRRWINWFLSNAIINTVVSIPFILINAIPYINGVLAIIAWTGVFIASIRYIKANKRYKESSGSQQVNYVSGWRSYRLNHNSLLEGAYGYTWPTNQLEADCVCATGKGSFVKHIDDPDSICGIYVVKDISNVSPIGVIASVVAWGEGIEYELGWRMQHCRIEKLYLVRGFFGVTQLRPSTLGPALLSYNDKLDNHTARIAEHLSYIYDVKVEVIDNDGTWETITKNISARATSSSTVRAEAN